MKRFILICLFALGTLTDATAGRDKAIQTEQLPEKAKTLISTYFSQMKVSYARMDKGLLDASYGVVFTNGSKIAFDKKGDWTDIECRNGIHEKIIPDDITKYIHEHHSGSKVIKIYHGRNGYEVKLDGGVEIKFDRKDSKSNIKKQFQNLFRITLYFRAEIQQLINYKKVEQ